ncbi:hypothetical protein DYB25_003553 [Aphanomyces astaci]|uniref:ER membrane protein complex subunit 4 n=2 Tax=Aphanomyces astaci TaxID=112090 RepID=A0A397BP10_APHAT|nr:hypothetical protein DYB25_003553 [Aphanomyces astaci]RHY62674.1 hypothetical protein DYB34_011583 [Aphanomyces astaci]RHY71051.1 hypothetical protein DYB38_011866 [Aphanomyces astaci]RHZ36461.1 hypothetical protein DYB26_015613 [Aphanomyces astaci]
MVRKWAYDLNVNTGSADPLGYNKHVALEHNAVTTTSANDTLDLKQKRASEIAQAPFKGLFQTGLMMYMSGSSINIFSIMITAMAIFNPLKALFNVNGAFASLEDGKMNLAQSKVTFVVANLVAIGVALYKCGTMGLLPTTSADWTWLLPVKQVRIRHRGILSSLLPIGIGNVGIGYPRLLKPPVY